MKGFVFKDRRYIAIRAIDYTKINYRKTQRILKKEKLSLKDIEYLKDVYFMLLFDTQSSIEKGFLIEVGCYESYKPKDIFCYKI